ncbi:hypothetical protein SEA_EFFIE_620 [Acinetobacter phage Effie]|nr:hypothetical protein SEA_EFFIE_620 [Acinetobacter phage Effie]
MSKIQHKTARLMKAFEKAVREHENSGSQHPEDQDSIQHAYHYAKEKLEAHMKNVSDIAELHIDNLTK